jgi:hypothetical protein
MVYSSTLKVEPIVRELNREHEEIVKMYNANPGAKFADLTDKYYARRKEKDGEEFKKMIRG